MARLIGRGLLFLASAALAASPVLAQSQPPIGSVSAAPLAPLPSAPQAGAPQATTPSSLAPIGAAPARPPVSVQFPAVAPSSGYSYGGASDIDLLETAIAAARRGQASAAQAAMAQMSDPVARKVALWAVVDASGEALPFFQLDQARRDLAGWPRTTRRQQVTEKAITDSGQSPTQVIAWFQGADPITVQGAMALASAYQLSGRTADAQALIRQWWRNKPFDAGLQRAMLTRYGAYLTVDDHIKRAASLLDSNQTAGLDDILNLLPPEQQQLIAARVALRSEASDANAKVAALPPSLANDPSLAVDSARYLMSRNLDQVALELAPKFPRTMPNTDAGSRNWALRRQMINSALKAGDYRDAYAAATNTGMTAGQDYTEAEFYAGWIALSKLHDPTDADMHFAAIQAASGTPITQARALYWRGRAADARGDHKAAKAFYTDGARYITTFYGQLAAAKAGMKQLVIGRDPVPTSADRARFEGREMVRGARMLAQAGEKDLFRAFVLCMAEALPNTEEYAMLVDLSSLTGDQDLAMRVVRLGAQHGYVLPERGYPVRNAPNSPEAAEAAMVFGITRQESGFYPVARSGVGARGMMQLMPSTAAVVARKIGESYSPGRLDDPDYNMRLGASYLGHMINSFNGSYVMAAAGYNAGPGRPAQWISYCGDPRAAGTDPVDFIECIPFSETRNYVMRVMEATEVYRARLNGGAAPLTLESDLKRGGYAGYQASIAPAGVAPIGGAPASRAPAVTDDDSPGIIDASTPLRVAPGVTVQGAVR